MVVINRTVFYNAFFFLLSGFTFNFPQFVMKFSSGLETLLTLTTTDLKKKVKFLFVFAKKLSQVSEVFFMPAKHNCIAAENICIVAIKQTTIKYSHLT